MKKIVIIIIFFFAFIENSKAQVPTGVPYTMNQSWYRFSGYIDDSLGILLPIRDTNWTPRKAAIVFNPNDSLVYLYNQHHWTTIASSSGDYVKYSDSLVIFVTPKQLHDSLGNFVTLNTVQTITASKTWNHKHTFTDSLGIGAVPTTIFDVRHNNAALMFDGVRLTLYDDVADDNILIGTSAGGTNLTAENIGIGGASLKNVTGGNNIALGFGNLSSFGTASNNVAVGVRSLQLSNGSNNTAVGYYAGVTTFGDSNTVIGYLSNAASVLNMTNINNSEIVIGTNTYSGAQTAAWITANSLVIGQRYPVLITFNGTIPSPFTGASTYANASISNSNTVQLDISLFTSQGTSTTTFSLYNKQNNSVAIGSAAHTDSSNQIVIGNSNNTVLKVNQFVVDIAETPTNGQTLVYSTSDNMYHPGAGGGGGGGVTTFPITMNNSGAGAASGSSFDGSVPKTISYNSIGAAASSLTISTTSPLSGGGDLSTNRTLSISNAAADGTTKGAATFTANDFNATSGLISIDYTNGQAASGSLKGFLTSADWTTFNNKIGVSSPTTGDILYYNAGWQKLAIGTTKQTLHVAGGVPVWRDTSASGAGIDYSYHTLTYAASITCNYNTGEKFVLAMTGNASIAFSNVVNGKTIYILIKQDATGGRTLTFPANTIFPLGAATGLVLNTTTTADGIDKVAVTYNNLTSNYEVELAKDYGN
jgi:hypothetical protein